MNIDFLAQLNNISATALDDLKRKTTYDELLQWLSAYLGFRGQFDGPLSQINDKLATEVVLVARSLRLAADAQSVESIENEWFHVPTGKIYGFCQEKTKELCPEAKMVKTVLEAYCLRAKQLTKKASSL